MKHTHFRLVPVLARRRTRGPGALPSPARAAARAEPSPTTPAAGRRAVARRLPPRSRRQAAHRGLQGRAALAVGPDPARRKDHAAAGRRRRREGMTPIELRDRSRGAEGVHQQPRGHGDRRRGDRADGVRDGRGESSGGGDAAGRITVLQALALAGGLKDFATRRTSASCGRTAHRRADDRFQLQGRDQGRAGSRCYLRPGDTVVVPD